MRGDKFAEGSHIELIAITMIWLRHWRGRRPIPSARQQSASTRRTSPGCSSPAIAPVSSSAATWLVMGSDKAMREPAERRIPIAAPLTVTERLVDVLLKAALGREARNLTGRTVARRAPRTARTSARLPTTCSRATPHKPPKHTRERSSTQRSGTSQTASRLCPRSTRLRLLSSSNVGTKNGSPTARAGTRARTHPRFGRRLPRGDARGSDLGAAR